LLEPRRIAGVFKKTWIKASNVFKKTSKISKRQANVICSVYGIFTYISLQFMVNGKYSSPMGAFGNVMF